MPTGTYRRGRPIYGSSEGTFKNQWRNAAFPATVEAGVTTILTIPKRERIVDSMLEKYVERQHRRRRNPGTIRNTHHALEIFQRYLDREGLPAVDVGLDDIEQWLFEEQEQYAITTVRQHYANVRAAYRYAFNTGVISKLPTVDVEAPVAPDREPHSYSIEELRRIHAAIVTPREDVAINLFMFTGMRSSEVRNLRWRDVDFEDQTLRVLGKGAKHRLVPVHPQVAETLLRHRPDFERMARLTPGLYAQQMENDRIFKTTWGADVTSSPFRKSMADLLANAGVEGTIHSFRRTVASTLDEAEIKDDLIDQILGWSRRGVRNRHYVRKAPERLQKAVLALYPKWVVS